MKKRVVITGMGAVTPIGNSVDEFWTNAKAGTVGIDEITKFSIADYKVKLAAELKNFDATAYMDRKEARRMDPFCQYAIAASVEAMNDSGLEVTEENADRIGVIIGSGIGGLGTIEAETKKLLEKGPGRVSPLMIPMAIGNMAAGNVAIRHGLKGKCTSVVTACATGTHSIGDAFRTIQYGEADAMLAGGCEAAITPLGLAGFMNLTALSESTDKNRASIPFDAKRDGFVMGEGAGVVVLEELEHAKARGAKIYAEIVGYGASCDAFHITSPMEDGSGAAKAMVEAIKEAAIEKEEVDYINAHGTSTPYNDLFETRAIKLAFGEYASKLAINSTKSMIGHLLGAAGGVEFIICVKSINDSYVHPTAGLQVADPECDLDYIAGKGRDMEVNYALSNSLGFGGHNASVLVKKYSE
ncbi:MAG TPA: beta-ketoacyl-[acyl-carrier-protein] synthase II [Lachnospiraceae bacterium]|uniref:beta-ketoacyl-ACP synthase II n=1 Tax=Anaerosporobacter sp. TaxID=1872529 RepID=UPI000EE9E4DD|nr:beta-ketoacyl-ACP synthase II [Anaerosporobacter sp.]HAB61251.1 beta-ketoacyl-[acyl-carrier-protein] synthase II [Lachnospiraceae bacterium]